MINLMKNIKDVYQNSKQNYIDNDEREIIKTIKCFFYSFLLFLISIFFSISYFIYKKIMF